MNRYSEKIPYMIGVVTIVCFITACSSQPPLKTLSPVQQEITKTQVIVERIRWDIPEELLIPCKDTVVLGSNTMKGLVRAVRESEREKKECVLRNNALIEFIKVKQINTNK